MNRLIALLAVALLAPALGADEVDNELAKMQGRWTVERLEENGKAEPAEEIKKFTINIDGTKFAVNMDGREESMKLQIDPDRSPKWINLTPEFGDDKGKTAKGIYELQGDTLRICARPKGGDRTTKFVSEQGTMLLVLKRK